MSLGTWLIDMLIWTTAVLVGTAILIDMLSERD